MAFEKIIVGTIWTFYDVDLEIDFFKLQDFYNFATKILTGENYRAPPCPVVVLLCKNWAHIHRKMKKEQWKKVAKKSKFN